MNTHKTQLQQALNKFHKLVTNHFLRQIYRRKQEQHIGVRSRKHRTKKENTHAKIAIAIDAKVTDMFSQARNVLSFAK
jgi:flagellar biosynthesis protein FliP